MKSFQDWLDCQLYSSHLKNLIKIKQQSLYMKSSHLNRKLTSAPKNIKNISYLDAPSRKTFKIKHHNTKCEMQQSQIIKQNLNLASRLVNVASVISKDKQVESYRKYQSLFKKNTNNKKFDYIKSNKLKKFMKINQANYVKGVHKAIVRIVFLNIPHVPEAKQPTVWVQLFSGIQKIRSPNFTLDQILNNQIKFPLKKRIDKNLLIKLHCSRGLVYINLGQYLIQTPYTQSSIQQIKQIDLISQQDFRKGITINLQIEDLTTAFPKHKSLYLR